MDGSHFPGRHLVRKRLLQLPMLHFIVSQAEAESSTFPQCSVLPAALLSFTCVDASFYKRMRSSVNDKMQIAQTPPEFIFCHHRVAAGEKQPRTLAWGIGSSSHWIDGLVRHEPPWGILLSLRNHIAAYRTFFGLIFFQITKEIRSSNAYINH